MSHPFFDSSSYPWHREDARAFHVEVYTAIGVAGQIDTVFKSCGPGLPPLAVAAADVMWKAVLEGLAAAQLLRVLGERLAETPFPKVHAAFKVLSGAVDPLQEPGIGSDRVFVDREKLRDALGKVAQSNSAATVLLVRGGLLSGKTWTKHVVEEQARSLGQGCIYLCDGLVGTVGDALDLIFGVLGGSPPPRLSTEDAWFRKACTEMMVLAANSKSKYWLVADDLGATTEGPKLDPLIRQFFDQAVLSMMNPAFAQWFRLVLIDYPDGKVPTKWKGFWMEDRPAEADVQSPAVAEFLLRWAARKKKKVLTDDEAAKLASDIIAKADTPQPNETRPRLERIHDELAAVLAGI